MAGKKNAVPQGRVRKQVPRKQGLQKLSDPVVAEGAKNDLAGVLIAVVAVALLIALVSPSSAPVTYAVGQGLILAFGAGAFLIPIALFVFAVTFFVASDGPISARVAIGLTIVVVAVLSMLSMSVKSAEMSPDIVFDPSVLSSTGGYLGAGIAWLLLRLMGKVVGMVLLVGMVLAGAIICGFSISHVVQMIQTKAHDARENFFEQRQGLAPEAAAAPVPVRYGRNSASVPKAALLNEDEAPATSYIGGRKTSVIKRGAEAITTLINRDRPELDIEDDSFVEPLPEASLDDSQRSDMPDFLRDGAPKTTKTKAQAKPKKSSIKDAQPDALRPGEGADNYELPPLSILKTNPSSASSASSKDYLRHTARRLQATLEEFGLQSHVEGWVAGPSVTTFKVAMGEGERVSKITGLQDDIALALAAKSIRIFAPIPGTSLVGIEVPNDSRQRVCLGDVLPYAQGGPLEVALGRDSEGSPIVVDLAGLPHLLVAGATGSGKSVVLNSMIVSMLMRATPEQVRLIMVDPKRVEFTGYAGLPHLYVPVVTEPKQAASALQWGVTEMERRLKVFEHYQVRNIGSYNDLVHKPKYANSENPPQHMPYFVIVIDELADLMMVAKQDVEASIVRIAQLGRAAGIHLVVATQRPSADVVTGLIKANIDNRIGLAVDNGMNSRIILDQTGAERLMDKGDMLVKLRGRRPKRAQGCLVTDAEIEKTVAFIREQAEVEYHEDILTAVSPSAVLGGGASEPEDDDPLVWEAAQIVVDSQLGSTSGLQRRLKVGYARAGRIMDELENKGIVGPPDGSKPREVLMDATQLEELRAAEAQYQEV